MKVVLLLFLALSANINCAQSDWYESSAFYQIYPRSFKDKDGDGIGDLSGITDKLKYLHDIGFKGVLLHSIFQSSSLDYGYDITDFRTVHADYGGIAALLNLIAAAETLDMKIILELVPNHSSDEHAWFNSSAHKIEPYTNYYVWHPGTIEGGRRVPPSNWQSMDEEDGGLGSAWTWNEIRGEYYYHKFHRKQPDLNFREPKVQGEFFDVLNFWLNRGVDGFSISSASYIYEKGEDENGNLPDENPSGRTNDTNSHDYLDHAFTENQDETFELLYTCRKVLDDYSRDHGGASRILLSESYSDLSVIKRFYSSEDGESLGAHLPLNFELIKHLTPDSKAGEIIDLIESFIKNAPTNASVNWMIGNHKSSRAASRLETERIQQYNALITLLPGSSFTYYGEEIGMTDVCVAFDEVRGLPYVCATSEGSFSEADVRTPLQWDSTRNSGFSSAPSTWLPVARNFKHRNVALQEEMARSHLQNYKKLLTLKEYFAAERGELLLDALNDNVLMIRREFPKMRQNLIAFLNFNQFYTHMGRFNLTNFNVSDVTLKIVKGNSLYVDNQVVPFEKIAFGPFDVIVGVYNASPMLKVNVLLFAIVLTFSLLK